MNVEPVETLPTRDEVIEMAEGQGMLAYEGGKRVLPANDRRIRCAICDAPAGEVTLMKVKVESTSAKTAAFLTHQNGVGYVCYGGDCAGQRNLALMRMFKRAAGTIGSTRRTKKGHALVWLDGKLEYTLTNRAHSNAKARRKQQAASRKANRG